MQTNDQRPQGSHFKSAEAHAAAKAEYLAKQQRLNARKGRQARAYLHNELRGLAQKVGA